MQNYDLPDANTGNTFNGVIFTLAGVTIDEGSDRADLAISPGFGLDPTLVLNTDSGIEINGSIGRITVNPLIVALTPGLYHWDLKITFGDGRIKTYIGGKWRINPIITV